MPTVGDLLGGRRPMTLGADATALEAARRMAEERIGAIVVTDDDARVLGIFTERDLMVRVVVAGRDAGATRLAEVMTREPFLTGPDTSAEEIRAELQARHVRHVPVVADGKLVGVLGLRDLVRADLEQKAREVRDMQAYIQGEPGPPE